MDDKIIQIQKKLIQLQKEIKNTLKPNMSDKLKEAYDKELLENHNYLSIAFRGLILDALNNQALARKIFNLKHQPEGMVECHPKRSDIGGIIIEDNYLMKGGTKTDLINQDTINCYDMRLKSMFKYCNFDINTKGYSHLEDLYSKAFNNIIGREDSFVLALLKTTTNYNHQEIYYKDLNLDTFKSLKKQIDNPTNCLIASGWFDIFLKDIATNEEMASEFIPSTTYEEILNGNMGKFMGVNLITDYFRKDKNIPVGTMIILTDPNDLGSIIERQELKNEVGNCYALGDPRKFILLHTIESFFIENPLGVALAGRCA